MYTITVKIAEAGTTLSSGEPSYVGHMWVTISDGLSSYSYGWHPNDPTKTRIEEPGTVKGTDDADYLGGPTSSHTFAIDQAGYLRVLAWAEFIAYDPTRFNGGNWHASRGNCIDFAWEAARQAGVDTSLIGDGSWWPMWNRAYFPTVGLPGTAEAEGWGGIIPSGVNTTFWAALEFTPRIDPLVQCFVLFRT